MKKIMLILSVLVYFIAAPFCLTGCICLAQMLHEMGVCAFVVNATCCLSVLFVPGAVVDSILIGAWC